MLTNDNMQIGFECTVLTCYRPQVLTGSLLRVFILNVGFCQVLRFSKTYGKP